MGGSSSKQTTGYRYSMGLHLVPMANADYIQEIKVGERTAWGNSYRGFIPYGYGFGRISINQKNLFGGDKREGGFVGDVDVLDGNPGQQRNDYLMKVFGPMIPAYRGVVSLVFRAFHYASNNHYLKPIAIRGGRFKSGWENGLWHPGYEQCGIVDQQLGQYVVTGMNPAHMIVYILTDPKNMGWPTSMIGGSFYLAANQLLNEGFGLNFYIDKPIPWSSLIQEICDHIGGQCYLSPITGQWELKLYREEEEYNIVRIGPDDIEAVESYEVGQWGEIPNEIIVMYTDWETGNMVPMPVQNLASISLQQNTIQQRRDYRGINHPTLAAQAALRDLRALGQPLTRTRLRVKKRALPRHVFMGDVISFEYPLLNIARMNFRVVDVNYGMLGDASLVIDGVEDVFTMEQSVISRPEPGRPAEVVSPQPPRLNIGLEASYWEIARRLSRADLAFIEDTDTFVSGLAVAGGSGQFNWVFGIGVAPGATEELPTSSEYTAMFTIGHSVPIAEDDTEVIYSASFAPERASIGDLCYMIDGDGDIVEAVSIVSINTGSLIISRGLLDTVPHQHPIGTNLVVAGDWIAYSETTFFPFMEVYTAATPWTTMDAGSEQEAINNPISLVGRQARPYAPGAFRIDGQYLPETVSGDLNISWAHRNRLLQTAYLVRQGEGDISPEDGQTYTIRVYGETGLIITEVTGITDNHHTITAGQSGTDTNITIELLSERDGMESYQSHIHSVTRVGYGIWYGKSYGGLSI